MSETKKYMFSKKQKILMGIAIVAALSAVAFSASAATSVYLSLGTGGNYYSPYLSYPTYSYGCGGCYGSSYIQPYYNDYNAFTYQNVYRNYPYGSYNYNYNYGGSFWNDNYRIPKFNNPPRPNPQAPITISGLGFTVPTQPQGNTGVPVQPAQNVCSFGTSWNGSSCVASNVTCPAGQSYNAGMNICLPNRSR